MKHIPNGLKFFHFLKSIHYHLLIDIFVKKVYQFYLKIDLNEKNNWNISQKEDFLLPKVDNVQQDKINQMQKNYLHLLLQ